MDRTAPSSLSKSLGRRLPLAVLIALTVAVVGGGAIGFATAAGEGTTFQVPAPLGGDEALYDVTASGSDWEDQQAHIEVRAPEPLMLEDGRWVSATRYRAGADASKVSMTFGGTEFEAVMVGWVSAFVDAATGKVVATTDGGGSGSSGSTGSALLPELGGSSSSEQYVSQSIDFGPGSEPCGVRAVLQERAVEVGERVTLAGCGKAGDPASFEVIGIRDLEGSPALLLSNDRTQLWYQAGIPYPVRLDLRLGSEREEHWTLARFTRGDVPLVPGPVPGPVDPAPIVDAPSDRYGPVATDFPMRFTLEQAVTRAAELSQEVADFLAAHPDWFVRGAEYEEEDQDGAVTGSWFVRVRGDDQEIWFNLDEPSEDDSPLPPAAIRVLGEVERQVDLRPSSNGVNVWPRDVAPEEPEWPSECRPASLPTIGSMAQRWSQMQQRPVGEANAYAFHLWCFGIGDALHASHQVMTGDARTLVPAAPSGGPLDPPSQQNTTQVLQMVGVDEERELTLETTEVARSRSSWGALQEPPKQEDARPIEKAGVGPWQSPSGPVAASITVLSVLAGLLYWLWPTLKAGPLALFSRLQGPAMLEHPVRKELLLRIEAQPGIHYQDLVRAMGKGKGAIEHHLRKLQGAGLVKALAAGGYTCWFPTKYDHRLVGAAPALKSAGGRAVLAAVRAQPGTSARDVGLATGLSAAAVNHHLQRLANAGLVDIVRAGRSLSILPTDLASQVGNGTAAGAA